MKHLYDHKIISNSYICKVLIGFAAMLIFMIVLLIAIEYNTSGIINLNIVLISLASVCVGLIIGLILPLLFKNINNDNNKKTNI